MIICWFLKDGIGLDKLKFEKDLIKAVMKFIQVLAEPCKLINSLFFFGFHNARFSGPKKS